MYQVVLSRWMSVVLSRSLIAVVAACTKLNDTFFPHVGQVDVCFILLEALHHSVLAGEELHVEVPLVHRHIADKLLGQHNGHQNGRPPPSFRPHLAQKPIIVPLPLPQPPAPHIKRQPRHDDQINAHVARLGPSLPLRVQQPRLPNPPPIRRPRLDLGRAPADFQHVHAGPFDPGEEAAFAGAADGAEERRGLELEVVRDEERDGAGGGERGVGDDVGGRRGALGEEFFVGNERETSAEEFSKLALERRSGCPATSRRNGHD
mmetsp:Transcript_22944/g.57007  ORF Transcript_22944/g.57007 Transcript_22944/m.57007 type:complete len:262 (+) Transcript_22944:628-1413(+)